MLCMADYTVYTVVVSMNKISRIVSFKGGGTAQRVGEGATLAMECEKWKLVHMHIYSNVNDIYGGLEAYP